MFNKCTKLHTIEMPLDFSSVTNATQCFDGANALVNVSLVKESLKVSTIFTSTLLSAESIQSITDGLATGVTGQTLTLSRTAVNKAFETSEGANNGSTDENSVWHNLIATKPNWTITLS